MNTDMTETLDLLCHELDFNNGLLLPALDCPSPEVSEIDWLEKGEWLSAAKVAGAEKVFFVDNNPAVVFATSSSDLESQVKVFNKVWNIGRPMLLFLATPGELSVWNLANKPIPNKDDLSSNDVKEQRLTSILHDIAQVSQQLQEYHRDNIDSGKVFEKGRFGNLENRADKALINDLKIVRRELIDLGLSGEKLRFAHALIGRSIFIRYLEDRNILTQDYFEKVARQKAGWLELITQPSSRTGFDFSDITAVYPRILQSKEFTYAFFRTLSKDFNGDMFPDVDQEEHHVEIEHLKLIQDLLYGDTGLSKRLFFFSYKFDIIPLDLISAIYEEFYHSAVSEEDKKSKAHQDGAYYTPPALAEFVISRVLTPKELQKQPVVLDPACGSGIFLVEAFRRMVRFKWHKKQSSLDFDELKQILGTQILGIEINQEAARITAFSLYLAMLHYLDPPSIQQHIRDRNKLPNLIASHEKSKNHFNTIRVANAFSGDTDDLGDIDVIVGNPPWGSPSTRADQITKERHQVMMDWCNTNSHPVGDKEQSQAFLWRAFDFLREGGRCALLTSAGVLFKSSETTTTFRKEWMSKVRLIEVFNFTHVRQFFFKGAISPFVMLHFTKAQQGEQSVEYWSAKQLIALKETQAIIFSKYDRAYLVGQDLSDNKTWKIQWFGRHADRQNLKQIYQSTEPLSTFSRMHCVGYKVANKSKPSGWLGEFNVLKGKTFSRYDRVELEECPPMVEHRGQSPSCYTGNRIIIGEGISQKNKTFGKMIARYETSEYAFNHSFHVLKLQEDDEWQYKVLLGCLWSSFARYYFFLTTANWGVWNDKVLVNERLSFPVKLNTRNRASNKIISIVDALRGYHPATEDISSISKIPRRKIEIQRSKWEAELDEAVFDLYELTEEQRDLIRDCCEVTLPFFYQPFNSVGVTPVIDNNDTSWIQNYAQIFANRWKPYLNDDEIMRADVHIGASGNMLALEFYPSDNGDDWDLVPKESFWSEVLEEIGKALPVKMGTSQIVLDGIVHVVSDNAIIVIKRNEKRFWTRSLAREDAETTLFKAMNSPRGGRMH